eukprot:391237-Pelagomonas_calceolata.AAC.1
MRGLCNRRDLKNTLFWTFARAPKNAQEIPQDRSARGHGPQQEQRRAWYSGKRVYHGQYGMQLSAIGVCMHACLPCFLGLDADRRCSVVGQRG